MQRHRAALGFRDVHQRVQHHEHAIGFLDAVGERLAITVGVGWPASAISAAPRSRVSGVRRSCETLSSASRMPGNQPFDLVEHLVEQPRQLVDLIVVRTDGHAFVGLTGGDDATHRRGQLPDRPKRRLRGQPAAGERDDDDRERHEAERGAEAREQVLARLGALPDLHERAVEQPASMPFRAWPCPTAPGRSGRSLPSRCRRPARTAARARCAVRPAPWPRAPASRRARTPTHIRQASPG